MYIVGAGIYQCHFCLKEGAQLTYILEYWMLVYLHVLSSPSLYTLSSEPLVG